MNTQKTFGDWLKTVDAYLSSRYMGITHDDLPDCCYADWYEDGLPAASAAKRAIRYANGIDD